MFRLLGIYNFVESLPRELLQMAPESSRMKAVKLESRRAGPLFEELRQTWRYHWTSREERKAENLKNRHSYTGKSFLEALIFASFNPQYDKRLFIEFP